MASDERQDELNHFLIPEKIQEIKMLRNIVEAFDRENNASKNAPEKYSAPKDRKRVTKKGTRSYIELKKQSDDRIERNKVSHSFINAFTYSPSRKNARKSSLKQQSTAKTVKPQPQNLSDDVLRGK